MHRKGPTGEDLGRVAREFEEIIREVDQYDLFNKRMMLRGWPLPRFLYKYRPIPPQHQVQERRYLEELILNNRLWLARPASFNDPFDGRAHYELPKNARKVREALVGQIKRAAGVQDARAKKMVGSQLVANRSLLEKMMVEAHDVVLDMVGICSFSADPRNPLMWSHYAANHTGICLQFQAACDLHAFQSQAVRYDDEYPVVRSALEGTGEGADALLQKCKDWGYEREWRVVALDEPDSARNFKPEALQGVIFGMRCPEGPCRDYILALLERRKERYGVAPKLYVASAEKRQYRLRISRLK